MKHLKGDSTIASTAILSATLTVAAISLYLGFEKLVDPLDLLCFDLTIMMISVICMLALLLRDLNSFTHSKTGILENVKDEEIVETTPATNNLLEEREPKETEPAILSEEPMENEAADNQDMELEMTKEETSRQKKAEELPPFLKKEPEKEELFSEESEKEGKTERQFLPPKIKEEPSPDTSDITSEEEEKPAASSGTDVISVMTELKSELEKFSEIFKKAKSNV